MKRLTLGQVAIVLALESRRYRSCLATMTAQNLISDSSTGK